LNWRPAKACSGGEGEADDAEARFWLAATLDRFPEGSLVDDYVGKRENCRRLDELTRTIFSMGPNADVGELEQTLITRSKARRGSARVSERMFFHFVRSNQVKAVFEIGANDGRHTRRFLEETESDIHCFEPNVFAIEHFAPMLANRRLKLNMFGLSNSNGVAPFHIWTEMSGKAVPAVGGVSSFDGRTDGSAKGITTTSAFCRGDAYLAANEALTLPIALWVDVEGHALSVLDGFGSRLADAAIVMCEIEMTNLFSSGANADPVIETLAASGHSVVFRDFQNFGQCNLVTLHESLSSDQTAGTLALSEQFIAGVASMVGNPG
jgi:FkbM family methyltransferase